MRAAVLCVLATLHALPTLASPDSPSPSLPPSPAAEGGTPARLGKKALLIKTKLDANTDITVKATPNAHQRSSAGTARARWQRGLDQRIGKPPAQVINVYNTWTHELMVVDASDAKAAAGVSQQSLDSFFRCHFTNQPTNMKPELFAALIAAANHFGSSRIDIVSGFRSPKYNLILRKKGREVARASEHTVGHAIDFRLRGVNVARLHAWAKRLRLGGVGFYPSSGFIHIDTGRIRHWIGR